MQISKTTSIISSNTPKYNNQITNVGKTNNDCYIKSGAVNFTGIPLENTLESTYKSIEGVHDPYSNILMLSEYQFETVKKQLKKCKSGRKQMSILSNYTYSMFPPEKEIYNLLRTNYLESVRNKKINSENFSLSEVIKKEAPEANKRLIKKELAVIAQMENATQNLSKKSQEKLKIVLEEIKAEIVDNTFRIRPSLDKLYKIKNHISEKDEMEKIIGYTAGFPKSSTSSDVFIIKHKDSTSDEIAQDLLKPAIATIEHIKPRKRHGEDSSINYLVVSSRMNALRSCKPYDEFLKEYPDIPEYCQKYTDDIISNKNDMATIIVAEALPCVKDRLFNESAGKIDINIDELNQDTKEQFNSFQKNILKLISKFQRNNNT